jgi:hypothetical protein
MVTRRAFIIFPFIMVLSATVLASEWKYFSTNINGTVCFYDSQDIIRAGNTVRVWGKFMLNDKDKVYYIKNHPKIHSIKNINYTIGRWEVDCLKYKFRVLSSNWYGSDGNIIYSLGTPNSQFLEVVPGSTIAKLVEIVCKKGEPR